MTSSMTRNPGTGTEHHSAGPDTCKQGRPSQGPEIRGSIGYSVHKMVEFGIPGEGKKQDHGPGFNKSRFTTSSEVWKNPMENDPG